MAFADLLAQDGVGVVWMLDVSTDNFATVSYRYATGSFVDGGGNRYEGRIKELGRYARGVGVDGFPSAGTIDLVLDNTDFAADWLVDRSTFLTTVLKARFRLRLGLYDPGASYAAHPTVTTQIMGEFVCLDWPSRDREAVRVSLADDTLGRIADLAVAPSVDDWIADAGSSTSNCIFKDTGVIAKTVNGGAPVQLAFGKASLRLERPHEGVSKMGGTDFFGCILVSVTTDTGASGDNVSSLVAEYRKDIYGFTDLAGQTLEIPSTYTNQSGTSTIWSVERSQSLSKDGKTWRIQWVKLNITKYRAWFDDTFVNTHGGGATPTGGVTPSVSLYPAFSPGKGGPGFSQPAENWAAFVAFHLRGYPLSARTAQISEQEGTDVIADLISYYSSGASASDIHTASFNAVKFSSLAYVSGVVQPSSIARQAGHGLLAANPTGSGFGVNKLREVIAEICASIDADFFVDWTGKFRLTSLKATFDEYTATPTTIDETRMANVEERTPSVGERWAPYNRLYVVQPNGETIGPFDHPTTANPSGGWGKIFTRTISGKWRVDSDGASLQAFAWHQRNVESVHRPILSFTTDISALTLEIGDLFQVTWTRLQGGSTPYAAAIFRVESFAVDIRTMSVRVEAVWMADIQSDKPYLLDDELLIVRAAGSGGRTTQVNGTLQTVTFSSGSLIADGVAAGDIFRTYYNPTDASDFTIARASRVVSVDSATQLTVVYTWPSTVSGISGWKILRGATTYHTSSSDPANYPSGGAMYGKACNASDQFSDSSAANKLKGG